MSKFTVIEWHSWEWLYIDGTLRWMRRARDVSKGDMIFAELLEKAGSSFDYCDVNSVPGVNAPDHDGCFFMVSDPPKDIRDIDYRINAEMIYMNHKE